MPESPRGALRSRLARTLGARLGLALLLLGLLLVLGVRADEDDYFETFTQRWILVLVAGTFAFIGAGAMGIRNGRDLHAIVHTQLAWDLLLASGLIYISGGASSIFVILYGATTLTAALLLGARSTLVVAGIGAALYLVIAIAVGTGLVLPPPDQSPALYLQPSRELGLRLLTNAAVLGAVGALATNLSSRLSEAGTKLEAAVARSEDLARLNDEIVNTVRAGLVVTSPAGQLVAVNPAAAQILGSDADELIGTPLERYFDLEAERPVARGEAAGRRHDGSPFPAGYALSPLADDPSRGSLVTFQDLTEVHALQRQAEAAERLATLGRLAAGLAHELRNPLGSISGSVQLVRDNPAIQDEDRHLLDLVVSEVQRLNALVTTMLDVGRPREPVRAPTDLLALARGVVDVARGDTPSHIALEIEEPQSADYTADVDADQIRQIVWNLIKNAVQASPSAPSSVRVGLSEDGERIAIAVSDEGPGIPAEDRARLFDAFFSKRPQGIGLGLALVRQVTAAHFGQIEVEEASPGGGARFVVTLPKRASVVPDDARTTLV